MLICLNKQDNGALCDTENPDGAEHCQQCGQSLRLVLQIHNPGTMIGRYRIVHMIGHGRFGAVYVAHDTRHNARNVAIKEIFTPNSLLTSLCEFVVLRDLNHESLPRYYDIFETNGHSYLVMEFVPGQSLKDMLDRRGGPLPEAQVVGYGIQLCDVVGYLHSQTPPIIHRDIKPHNIRVTPEGVVKLVDFGLLKQLGEGPARQGFPALTRSYAAPEQWKSISDQLSDIYGIGATFYHLLTGYAPPSAARRLAQHTDPLPPPQHVNARISPPLAQAVMKAMQLASARRYTDAMSLKQALMNPHKTVIIPARTVGPAVSQPNSSPVGHAAPSRTIKKTALHIFQDHDNAVTSVAFSANGQIFTSGSDDSTIRLWRVTDGALLNTLKGHSSYVTSVALSPDGKFLASSGYHEWRLWRVIDGALMTISQGYRSFINKLAFSPDGHILAGGSSDGTVWIWRAADGTILNTLWGHRDWVNSVAFSPDGEILATASSDKTVRLWRVRDGLLLHRLQDHASEVTSVAFSPGGRILASGSWDYTIRLWHIPDGTPLNIFRNGHHMIYSVAFHPRGHIIASGNSDQAVQLLRTADCTALTSLRGHTDTVNSVAFHPNGRILASGSGDRTVRWWRVE